MRFERHFGKIIICGIVFKNEDIEPEQTWMDSSGHTVIVESIVESNDGEWINYRYEETQTVRRSYKDTFSFQCRYSLIVPENI